MSLSFDISQSKKKTILLNIQFLFQAKSSQRRSASLQYCEVQIVDGQSKCQMPVSKRSADSHYTTINEESTKAFLQTCRQQELSHKK